MSVFRNVCRFNATSVGSGPFVVASHVTTFKTPAEAYATDGKTYRYHAEAGSQEEYGEGVYTAGTLTLTRVTVYSNSEDTTVPINFTSVPQVDVFPSPPPVLEAFTIDTGTLMLFQQSAAPTGWTKQTTHNDKALRVVSGSASSGGSNAFSTVMAQTVVGSHTLVTSEIPSHAHRLPTVLNTDNPSGIFGHVRGNGDTRDFTLESSEVTGGGGSHNHPITMNISYVDLIICARN